jgi:NAD(P)-dependent dehydrogenase (short-subunit alcohol dehydrogenase family)
MEGKVALVTGASGGIGFDTAVVLAERGAKVAIAARRKDQLDELVTSIQDAGGEAVALQTDVSKVEDVRNMVDGTLKAFGRLDIAVNNAGVEGEFAPIHEFDEDAWDQVLGINLRGNFLCLKYQSQAMLAQGEGGAIVNVGSVNSYRGFAGGSAYATSKHGQIALTSCASAELAPQGIRVNLVCPGVIRTPMHERLRGNLGDDGYDDLLENSVHLRRAGQPQEIAKTIAFLGSDDASYITGATLTADGGLMNTV